MASKPLVSLGSFRSLAGGSVAGETPEERYRRLEQKYGRELHEAIARKDKLKEERKVRTWMEVYVLLSELEPRPVNRIPGIKTPNGQLDPVLAAGIISDPLEEAMLRKAALPSLTARKRMAQNKDVRITKEDREKCAQWLKQAVESEKSRLESAKQQPLNGARITEIQERLAGLEEQLAELSTFEESANGKELSIAFEADSFLAKRAKKEVGMALIVALVAFVAMLVMVHFSH